MLQHKCTHTHTHVPHSPAHFSALNPTQPAAWAWVTTFTCGQTKYVHMYVFGLKYVHVYVFWARIRTGMTYQVGPHALEHGPIHQPCSVTFQNTYICTYLGPNTYICTYLGTCQGARKRPKTACRKSDCLGPVTVGQFRPPKTYLLIVHTCKVLA